MESALDVYKRPFNELNLVVCMDESLKQLIGETRTDKPMRQGKEKRLITSTPEKIHVIY